MKKLKNYAVTTIGFVLFVAVFVFSVPQSGHSKVAADKDVVVVNTTSQPVPVAVQGTPTVQFSNDENNPVIIRDADRPTAQPFQYQAVVELEDGQGSGDVQIPVPEGKMLVIEYISVNGSAPSNHQIYASLLSRVRPDDTYRPHYIQYTKQDYGSFNNYTANQQTRIYADAPSVTFRLQNIPATGSANFRCTISGYFVDK